MPDLILRNRAGRWEPTDAGWLRFWGYHHVLERALFHHRRFPDDACFQVEDHFLFIWTGAFNKELTL